MYDVVHNYFTTIWPNQVLSYDFYFLSQLYCVVVINISIEEGTRFGTYYGIYTRLYDTKFNSHQTVFNNIQNKHD